MQRLNKTFTSINNSDVTAPLLGKSYNTFSAEDELFEPIVPAVSSLQVEVKPSSAEKIAKEMKLLEENLAKEVSALTLALRNTVNPVKFKYSLFPQHFLKTSITKTLPTFFKTFKNSLETFQTKKPQNITSYLEFRLYELKNTATDFKKQISLFSLSDENVKSQAQILAASIVSFIESNPFSCTSKRSATLSS